MGFDIQEWHEDLDQLMNALEDGAVEWAWSGDNESRGATANRKTDKARKALQYHVNDLAIECENLATDVHRLTTERAETRAKVRVVVKVMRGKSWGHGGSWVNSLTEAIGDPQAPLLPDPESCTNCSHLQPMWPEMTYYGVCDKGHGTLKHGQCFRGMCGGDYKLRRVRL